MKPARSTTFLEPRQPWVYAMMVASMALVLSHTVGILADYLAVQFFLPKMAWDWDAVLKTKWALASEWVPLLAACGLFLAFCFGETANPPKWTASLVLGAEIAVIGQAVFLKNTPLPTVLANLIVHPVVQQGGDYCLMPTVLLTDVFWVCSLLFFPALFVELRTLIQRTPADHPDLEHLRILDLGLRSILLGAACCLLVTAILNRPGVALLSGAVLGTGLVLGSIVFMVFAQLCGIPASPREAFLTTLLSALGTALSGVWVLMFVGETLGQLITHATQGNWDALAALPQSWSGSVVLGVGLLLAVSLGTSVTFASAVILRRRLHRCTYLGGFTASLWLVGLLLYWTVFRK
jgi:hypothetical protein